MSRVFDLVEGLSTQDAEVLWQVFTKKKKKIARATPYSKCPVELARIITCFCEVPKHDKV